MQTALNQIKSDIPFLEDVSKTSYYNVRHFLVKLHVKLWEINVNECTNTERTSKHCDNGENDHYYCSRPMFINVVCFRCVNPLLHEGTG